VVYLNMLPRRRVFEVPDSWLKTRTNGKPTMVKPARQQVKPTVEDADFRRVLAGKLTNTFAPKDAG